MYVPKHTHTHTQAQASRHSHAGKHTYTHAHRKRKLKKNKKTCVYLLSSVIKNIGLPIRQHRSIPSTLLTNT